MRNDQFARAEPNGEPAEEFGFTFVGPKAGAVMMKPSRRTVLAGMFGAGLGVFARDTCKKFFAIFMDRPEDEYGSILMRMEHALLAFHNTNWTDLTVTLNEDDHQKFMKECGDLFGKASPRAHWYSSGIGEVLVVKACSGGKTKIDANWDGVPIARQEAFKNFIEMGFKDLDGRRAKMVMPTGDVVSVKLTQSDGGLYHFVQPMEIASLKKE